MHKYYKGAEILPTSMVPRKMLFCTENMQMENMDECQDLEEMDV